VGPSLSWDDQRVPQNRLLHAHPVDTNSSGRGNRVVRDYGYSPPIRKTVFLPTAEFVDTILMNVVAPWVICGQIGIAGGDAKQGFLSPRGPMQRLFRTQNCLEGLHAFIPGLSAFQLLCMIHEDELGFDVQMEPCSFTFHLWIVLSLNAVLPISAAEPEVT